MKVKILLGAALVCLAVNCRAESPAIVPGDMTLVSWVSVGDPDVKGGSAVTIGQGSDFDGIVYGERVDKKWNAGSEFWNRTPANDRLAGESAASPGTLTQVALVHRGGEAMLFTDGHQVASWHLAKPSVRYGAPSYVMFGQRHQGVQNGGYFNGTIRDSRIYDHALDGDQIAALKPGEQGGAKPVAWWDFASGLADKTGRFPDAELKGNAKLASDGLHLGGEGDYVVSVNGQKAIDRLQFRPAMGNAADPIPFYWKGQYHVFYLQGGIGRVPWQHLVSDNLVDWKQLPTALSPSGPRDGWDGGNMFTGTVIENAGKFYVYYTGDNGANPLGHEGVRMATSDDLVTWTKHPDFLIIPDGATYLRKADKNWDFRDPFPYKIEGKNEWWMILCANDAQKAPGVYTSSDLKNWTPQPPLNAELQECPDLFKIGDTYYLLGADHYATSKELRGKFVRPVQPLIDRPGIYAGKSMFDGKRHIFVGWIADAPDFSDDDQRTWGGTLCTPRELVPGPDGVLYVRPVQEAINAFSKPVIDTSSAHPEFDASQWKQDGNALVSQATPAHAYWTIPNEGMLTMKLKLSLDARVTVAFHSDPDKKQDGYLYSFSPADSHVVTHGQNIDWVRDGCKISAAEPVTIRAILIGTSIEFFINDQYAFTRRAYELRGGKLGLELTSGSATVEDIQFRQLPPK